MLYTKGVLETRAIRMKLKQTEERHGRLIDILSDGLYELDIEGRFVYLSPLATEMLGYAENELIGTPYSAVVPPDQQDRARRRFNERRTGTRAARRMEIDLIRKTSSDKSTHTRVRAEISARGCTTLIADTSEHWVCCAIYHTTAGKRRPLISLSINFVNPIDLSTSTALFDLLEKICTPLIMQFKHSLNSCSKPSAMRT